MVVVAGLVWFGLVCFGSVRFGGVRRPGGRVRIKNIYMVAFFVVQFGSVWFRLIRRGLAGFGAAEDARWPGGQEEKTPPTPPVVQW